MVMVFAGLVILAHMLPMKMTHAFHALMGTVLDKEEQLMALVVQVCILFNMVEKIEQQV